MMGKEKPIWRLAFFSRLEERKGIKLFVEAVSALKVTDEKFEVRSFTPLFKIYVVTCTSISGRTERSPQNIFTPLHGC